MTRFSRWTLCALLLMVTGLSSSLGAQTAQDAPLTVRKVIVGNGVELHYVDRGTGTPVVFVHGSLSDGSYWNDQVNAFAQAGYRAIAYSRRHSPPNKNKAQPSYSAVVDADDLAGLITKLHLGRVHVVGHSYGALTALFLAIRHPELLRTLVLAEAPAVPLLEHLEGDRTSTGKATFADIQERMVNPMKAAFEKGDREAGCRAFINYVLNDANAWQKMPEAARQDMLSHAGEWDVMMTTGELFPMIQTQAVRKITAPALILSGEKSYGFLGLIDEELARLLPHARRIILRGATHRMWFEQPEACRNAVLEFWREVGDRRNRKSKTLKCRETEGAKDRVIARDRMIR
ncbi:MAG TPA: alpha/beta hydrolase [Candidatus Angelobacter sp.]|nr:alpha/beta hydrolase [Candidatus Angelobacter sp.]